MASYEQEFVELWMVLIQVKTAWVNTVSNGHMKRVKEESDNEVNSDEDI